MTRRGARAARLAALAGSLVLPATGCSKGPAAEQAAPKTQAPPSADLPMSRPPEAAREAQRPTLFDPTVYQIPVSDKDPQKGARDALITLVMFGDFQCEFTQQALVTVSALVKKYGDDLRLVWKHRPMAFHYQAAQAATLSLEAFAQGGSQRFWEAAELLLQNQSALNRPDLENYARQLGLNEKKVKAALDNDLYKAKLAEDDELSRRIEVPPTSPMFAINGRYIRGAQKQRVYELLIDEELAKAKARLTQGTPKAKLYDEILAQGSRQPPATN